MRSHGQKSGGGHDAIENLPDYVGKPTPAKKPDIKAERHLGALLCFMLFLSQ